MLDCGLFFGRMCENQMQLSCRLGILWDKKKGIINVNVAYSGSELEWQLYWPGMPTRLIISFNREQTYRKETYIDLQLNKDSKAKLDKSKHHGYTDFLYRASENINRNWRQHLDKQTNKQTKCLYTGQMWILDHTVYCMVGKLIYYIGTKC